jgi:hypothetical protein
MPPTVDRIRAIRARAASGREVTLVYAAETASGLKGGISEKSSWEIQGFVEDYNFSIWVDAEAFDAELKTAQPITVDNEVRRILNVRPDALGALIRIDVGRRYGS